MIRKKKTIGCMISQREIAPGIYDMRIKTELAQDAAAGQFVGVYPQNKATLLPRPISICEINKEEGSIRLVYRVAGMGTAEFAAYEPGEEVLLLGVLGNTFPVEETEKKRVFLMGGGIGIPPMLELAKEINRRHPAPDLHIFVGYRNRLLFLQEELERYGRVHIATEDGSVGTKGNVMDGVSACGLQPGVIMACGPMPMLRAIKAYGQERGVKTFLSLEEHMACGVGACLGCVCRTKNRDLHSHVNYARICTEGPVFEAGEVEI